MPTGGFQNLLEAYADLITDAKSGEEKDIRILLMGKISLEEMRVGQIGCHEQIVEGVIPITALAQQELLNGRSVFSHLGEQDLIAWEKKAVNAHLSWTLFCSTSGKIPWFDVY